MFLNYLRIPKSGKSYSSQIANYYQSYSYRYKEQQKRLLAKQQRLTSGGNIGAEGNVNSYAFDDDHVLQQLNMIGNGDYISLHTSMNEFSNIVNDIQLIKYALQYFFKVKIYHAF